MKYRVTLSIWVGLLTLALLFLQTSSEICQSGYTSEVIKSSDFTYNLPDATSTEIHQVQAGEIDNVIYLFGSTFDGVNKFTFIAKYDSDFTSIFHVLYGFKSFRGSWKVAPLEETIFWVGTDDMNLYEINSTSGVVSNMYSQGSTSTGKLLLTKYVMQFYLLRQLCNLSNFLHPVCYGN